MTVVGFTGNIGAGKTTCSNYLIKKYGFKRYSFKDCLLDEVRDRFPDLLREILSYYTRTNITNVDELLKYYPRPPLVRALLQNYGSDVRRKDDPGYWVERWVDKIDNSSEFDSFDTLHNAHIVVDDVRFLNEAEAVRTLGGTLWRVNGAAAVTNFKNHISETEQTKIAVDGIIVNHGTIEELHKKLDDIFAPD